MIITSANAVYYLIERGFLTFESAVDGDLMTVNSASNHRNIKVIRKQNPGYFIKQVQKWEMDVIGLIQREATCYWLGYNDEDFASLVPLMPKFYDYDYNKHSLIIELLPDGETLYQLCLRAGSCPAELAFELGGALGTYLRRAGAKMKLDEQASAVLTKTVPWILALQQQPGLQASFNRFSGELSAFIQSNNQFYAALDTLAQGWRYDSFIHGDIKLDNYVINPPANGDGKFSFKVIDWELAGFGDAGWDLGSAFQTFLAFPIISMQAVTRELPKTVAELLQFDSYNMRSAVRECWKGYVAAMQIDDEAVAESLEQGVRFCAARMMQTAFECTQTLKGGEAQHHTDIIRAKAFCLLLIAADIFQNPASAVQSLFAD
jgi:hypothetical protein